MGPVRAARLPARRAGGPALARLPGRVGPRLASPRSGFCEARGALLGAPGAPAAFARGAAFPRRERIAILVGGVTAVLAETLALFLSVTSTGTPRAQPALEAPDNVARARRGLLPRKVVRSRPPSRARRLVLRPAPPTWLGEPAAPALDAAVELAVDTAAEPVAPRVELAAAAAVASDDAPPEVRAALEGADVEALVIRRVVDPEGAAVHATLGDPQLEVVVLRRPADAAR